MSPIVVALTFIGLWLLVGLGVFFVATSARSLLGWGVTARVLGEPGPNPEQLTIVNDAAPVRRAFRAVVAAVGLVLTFGGLVMLASLFVVH
jgi:hypothetical protein